MKNLANKQLNEINIGSKVKLDDCFGVYIVEATFHSASKGNEASVKNDKGSYMFVPFSQIRIA